MEHNSPQSFWHGIARLADPKLWIASTVPLLIGVLLSVAYTAQFDLLWMLLAFTCIYCVETGKNAVNECVDYWSGTDALVDEAHRTPFSGGKRVIVGGYLTFVQTAIVGLIAMIFSICIGLVIVLVKEPKVLWFGIAGTMAAITYSLPPFKLCYRGLGEVTVGITYGPLMIGGMYLVMSGKPDPLPVLVSLPIGFFIAAILWINQFPDYEADYKSGKQNGVVKVGKAKAAWYYGAIMGAAYLSFIPIVMYTGNPVWLIGWATIPLAVKSFWNSVKNTECMEKLVYSNKASIYIYALTGFLLGLAVLVDAKVLRW